MSKLFSFIKNKFMFIVREIKHRKRVRELRKKDPFIY